MPSVKGGVRGRLLDVLTVLVSLAAIAASVQPGSVARTIWTKYHDRIQYNRAVKYVWPKAAQEASPLFASAGPPDIVEISDYECPFCRATTASVDSAVRAGAKLALLQVPGPTHSMAEGAALSALCAEEAGRFREMHERLMSTSSWRTDSNWTREAQLAGVKDLAAFDACRRSEHVRKRLARHREFADSLHAPGTPMFVTPDAYRVGMVSARELRELARNKGR